MLPIGREGKRKGFETETQEVLNAIGSAYCSLKSCQYEIQGREKFEQQNELLFTERHDVLTYVEDYIETDMHPHLRCNAIYTGVLTCTLSGEMLST